VAAEEVLNPSSPNPDILVAFNAPSLAKFGPATRKGGTIIYDRSVVADPPKFDPSVRVFGVPMTEIAVDLGRSMVKNIVALGALQAATQLYPADTFLTAIRQALKDVRDDRSMKSLAWGIKSVNQVVESMPGGRS
jgi:Pyruvate/2-oxoacid:ferredoxin oxidoreductase gamma subunit